MKLVCIGCGKTPSELPEYIYAASSINQDEPNKRPQMTPDTYVMTEEGTLNEKNGHFACDNCYIKMGQPSVRNGQWVAP